MDQTADEVAPPWGSLPIEIYLLRKWHSDSTLSVEEQRAQLIQAFMQEDDITSVIASITADALEAENIQDVIRQVLMPWRPQKLRRIAEMYVTKSEQLFGEFVLLRTYYGGGKADDDRLLAWLQEADPFDETFGDPDASWWRVLDDKSLFDMDTESWRKVYDMLPELAVPRARNLFSDKDIDAVKERVLAPGNEHEPEEDDYEDAIREIAATSGWYLLVADEQAFKEEEFGLVFQDVKGNIVKQGTVKPEEVQYILQYASRGALFESEYWLDAAVGEKYKPRGEIMRAALPIVMADFES